GLPAGQIGSTANFFELGGHSLLIIQMLARLQSAGLRVDAHSVFASATLGDLAARIEQTHEVHYVAPPNAIPAGCTRIEPAMLPLVDLTQDEIDAIVAMVPGGAGNVQDIYPLAPLQEGVLFHHLMHEEHDPYVLPLLLSVEGEARRDAFLAALQATVARHDVLRTAVLTRGLARPVQLVLREAVLPVEELALDPAEDAQVQLQRRLEARVRMDLSSAPLLRASMAQDPDSARWYLLLHLHHIVCDHIGMEIIQHELHAHLAGQGHLLAPAQPYREFVAHALHQAGQRDAEAFFHATLGDVDEPTAPFQLLDVHGDGGTIEQASRMLDDTLASRIRAMARRQRVSPAVLFHAAWALVVSACSGRDDVVFGTVLSGRLQGTRGAEAMMGMFINTLPLRLRLDGRDAVQLVSDVDTALRALLPYEQTSLARAQACSALPSGTPLFSAVLNYRHTALSEGDVEDEMSVLGARERTNYPFAVSVNDFGQAFSLDAQVDRSVEAARVLAYVEAATESLLQALE
ncbi:condensation domain-containing protein, partial [Massilia sp.]|uniref:condensation domain-containing protein n=1 Tax=Massilia sp. TaxID=1882437 RepID=UPI00352E50A2